MSATKFNHIAFAAAIIVFCCFILCGSANAQSTKSFKTNLTQIYFSDEAQLDKFFELVKPKTRAHSLNKVLLGGHSHDEKVALYFDTVFRRVQLILNMVMPKLKVNIYLFPTQAQLWDYFNKIHGGPTSVQAHLGVTSKLPSFYYKKTNTIYAQSDFFSLGILAHEMGHCVTEHYFVVRPPQRVSELMSQFVDQEITAGRF